LSLALLNKFLSALKKSNPVFLSMRSPTGADLMYQKYCSIGRLILKSYVNVESAWSEKKGLKFTILNTESASCLGAGRLEMESLLGRMVSLLISWANESLHAAKKMINNLILNGNIV
jgi:hypothetical protein